MSFKALDDGAVPLGRRGLAPDLESSFGSRNRIIEIGYRRGRHRAEYRLMSIRSYPREKK